MFFIPKNIVIVKKADGKKKKFSGLIQLHNSKGFAFLSPAETVKHYPLLDLSNRNKRQTTNKV